MVPVSCLVPPKGQLQGPYRGCRAAPEQGPPLDGASSVLVQVDSIFQEDDDRAQGEQSHNDCEGNLCRTQS